jgi:gluconate 2-dehydrogenase gamma chain
MKRREMLQRLGTAVGAGLLFTWTTEEAAQASEAVRQAGAQAAGPYVPRFFTASEYAAISALSDLILPKDDRSGSASDAGTPAFIDFIVAEQPERQTAMRGGLVWIDTECRTRFDRAFMACSDAERRQVLDDIAWPARAKPEMRHGVRFFTTLRDLVAAGFFSSRIGVADLGYTGNRPAVWDGPPVEVLKRIGVN